MYKAESYTKSFGLNRNQSNQTINLSNINGKRNKGSVKIHTKSGATISVKDRKVKNRLVIIFSYFDQWVQKS